MNETFFNIDQHKPHDGQECLVKWTESGSEQFAVFLNGKFNTFRLNMTIQKDWHLRWMEEQLALPKLWRPLKKV